MEEMAKHGQVGLAAMRAGMDRKTARKYVKTGRLPSELASPRTWRTRPDPFVEDWPALAVRLEAEPGLQAKTLFELLCEERPGRYEPGQLRTLQRRVRLWRAQQGPPREVVFAQAHRPGEAAQTDFTETASLAITIAGEAFVHLLCVFVLPFSNGSGRRRASPSRWRRCAEASRRRSSSLGGCRSSTRRTTRLRRRTGSRAGRKRTSRDTGGRSTMNTSRSCATSE
jgi:hypothetical protein